MGKDLSNEFSAARLVFEEVDDALKFNLSRLMFQGDQPELSLTENTQPALLAHSMAVWRVLQNELDLRPESFCSRMMGHSLGEYSALCASGALSLADAARLTRARGKAMTQCMKKNAEKFQKLQSNDEHLTSDLTGAMAALMPFSEMAAHEVCQRAREGFVEGTVCQVANINSSAQVVISGHRHAVERAVALAKAGVGKERARRAVMLDVSAPFHCDLMSPAAESMAELFKSMNFSKPAVPIVSNVTAQPISDPEQLKELLVKQITAPVLWLQMVHNCLYSGSVSYIEFGTGNVLSSLVKQIATGPSPSAMSTSISSLPLPVDVMTRAVGTAEDVKSFILNYRDS